MKVAIKVGGSVFCPQSKPDPVFVGRLAKKLILLSAKHKLLVVVGGGKRAREKIQDAKYDGKTDEELHSIGIQAARENASDLVQQLRDLAYQGVPKSVEEVRPAFRKARIVVVGGFTPGQTTDAVTVQSAKAIGADIIIIGTDVKGVFASDPHKHPHAKFKPRISVSELRKLVEKGGVRPGQSTIVDPVAAALIEKILKPGKRVVVLDIHDLANMEDAIYGREFVGTEIRK